MTKRLYPGFRLDIISLSLLKSVLPVALSESFRERQMTHSLELKVVLKALCTVSGVSLSLCEIMCVFVSTILPCTHGRCSVLMHLMTVFFTSAFLKTFTFL